LFWCALVAGVVVTIAVFVDLPDVVIGMAFILFVFAARGAFGIAVRSARQEGTGVVGALARGAAAALRWFVAFLP
jgi:hypothetical protein